MGQKYSEKEIELYKRIDEIIYYLWDPIGVAGAPEARDEYYSYLPEVYRLAKIKNSKNEIANYLNNIQSKNMGLKPNIKKCKEIAETIKRWSKILEMEE